jgi:hypothetical protein
MGSVISSDNMQGWTSIAQFIDPVVAPGILAVQNARMEEKQLKMQARAVEGQARLDAEQARLKNLFQTGQEYLYFARAGVFSGVGAPLDILTQNALEREKEALSIELKGWNAGKQLRVQGVNLRRSATLQASRSMVDIGGTILSKFGMGASALSGIGSGATVAGGASYAAGLDAAAGGAAAVNGAGTGLGALALV